MQKNVMISIRGDQEFEETGKDTTEFVTEGTLTSTDYGYLLEYDESAFTRYGGNAHCFPDPSRFHCLDPYGRIPF